MPLLAKYMIIVSAAQMTYKLYTMVRKDYEQRQRVKQFKAIEDNYDGSE